MKNIILYLLITILLHSCASEDSVTVPSFSIGSSLSGSTPIPDSTHHLIDGIYNVEEGVDFFGKTVVMKWNGSTFSIFTGKSFAFFVLSGGVKDSVIIFEGYWRYAQESSTGLAQLKIFPNEGGRELLGGIKNKSRLVMRGSFGNGNNFSEQNLVFRFSRDIEKRSSQFYIIAHRGGGRNLDQPPDPENSLEIIKRAENFGANAIEIDVRLTKDGVPIIFHDENLSSRLVIGEFAVGPIKNYPYSHLLAYCKLKNGEPIPTLEQALETVITKTNLSLVWMDIKDVQSISSVIKLQKKYSELALSYNRKVEFLIGLPDDDTKNEFLKYSKTENIPSLCELDFDSVMETKSIVWAPAWTRGPMTDQVNLMKGFGKRVFFWTVDAPEFIKVFLEEGAADGILTNYPSVVAYQYYVK